MRVNWLGIVPVLLCLGCLSQNNDENSEHVPEVPEDIRQLDSLAVYSLGDEPVYDIQFEQVLTVEEGYQQTENPETYIGSVDNFAVDNQNRIYIYSESQIHVLNSEGNHLNSLGGEGRGPGEFQSLGSFTRPVDLKVQRVRLYAWDRELQRINVYSLESLENSHTISLEPSFWNSIYEVSETASHPHEYYPQKDGTLLVGFKESFASRDGRWLTVSGANPMPEVDKFIRYYRMSRKGQIVSGKIFERLDVNFYPGNAGKVFPGIPPHLPSTRSSLIAVAENGNIFEAWTGKFLIKAYDENGSYRHSFYYPYDKSRLNRDDIFNHSFSGLSSQSREALGRADFSDTWPALNIMLVDDQNRLWISTITDDEEKYQWRVLDEKGRLLVKFKWPGKRLLRHSESNQIRTVANGYLYVYKTDNETGIGRLVRYRIIMS